MKRAKSKTSRKTANRRRGATEQNWEDRMQAARLNSMAAKLLGIPFAMDPKPDVPLFNPRMDEPLQPLFLGDADRWQIANFLRSLSKPAVLRALRRAQTRIGRRGPKSDPARLWKAALDLQISKRPKEVMHAWALGKSWLYEIKRLSLRQPRCLPGHWRYWAAYELRVFRNAHRHIAPRSRRAALIEQLRAVR